MKLVIDIPEEDYKSACKREFSMDGSMMIYNAIREGTEYKERPHGEWVPCSDRLPEESGFYLITGKSWGGGNFVWIEFYRKNESLWASNGVSTVTFENGEILAWMPLPEPYKEGDSE